MELSKIGIAAHECWLEIPEHFPFVQLDEFVIMPNHMHGIISINKNGDCDDAYIGIQAQNTGVQTPDFASLHYPSSSPTKKWETNKFGPQSKNLASIIRGYKIGGTKISKHLHPDWAWQPRHYESIIRNQKHFDNIRNYIHTTRKNGQWINYID